MFFKRLLSGIMLVAISFVFIYLGGKYLAGLLTFISCVAYFEMGRALKLFEGKKQNVLMIFGYVAISAYYTTIALSDNVYLPIMSVILTIIGFLFIYVFSYPKYGFETISAAVFSFLYAPIMLSFMYHTRELEYGKYIVWIIYISAWGSDTLAYCVGMLTGKTIGNHKMTPKLSPKKSIEGAIGGVLGAALLAWLYAHFVLVRFLPADFTGVELKLAAVGAVGGFVAMLGDLAASAIKRNKDIKDYGHLIPGHGGIMDRFDSMIITAPLTFFLAALMLGLL